MKNTQYALGIVLRTYQTAVGPCTGDCLYFEVTDTTQCDFWSYQISTQQCTLFQNGNGVIQVANTDYFSGEYNCQTI